MHQLESFTRLIGGYMKFFSVNNVEVIKNSCLQMTT